MIAVLDTWPLIDDRDGLRARLQHYRSMLVQRLRDDNVAEQHIVPWLRRFDRALNDNPDPDDPTSILVDPKRIVDIYRYYATPGDPRCSRLPCDNPREEPEQMPDHGLFIADVIKDIAPGVDISVYRVLNDWGVGDLRTLAKGLELAIDDANGRPLVINLSLGVCPQMLLLDPLFAERVESLGPQTSQVSGAEFALRKSESWVDRSRAIMDQGARPEAVFEEFDPNDPNDPNTPKRPYSGVNSLDMLQRQGLVARREDRDLTFDGILKVIDILLRGKTLPSNVLLVAAAGNDSCPGHFQDPRIPAAFEGVLGVSSAVPTGNAGKWRRSSFSNADDLDAPDDGVAAFGGDVGAGGRSSDGPVGLYVADEWHGVNDLGIVQWSGTSFATPLVTAYAAAIWSAAMRSGDDVDAPDVLDAVVNAPNGAGERRLIPLANS